MARGSIYPRNLVDGTLVYDVRYRSSNGVQKHKRGFRGKRAAQAYLAEQLALVNRGELIVCTTPFEEYFDGWLAEHRPRIEPGTWREYEVHGRLRLKPYFGYQKLSQITRRDVRRFVAEQVEQGKLSHKTINNAIIVLSVCLAHAVDDGLLASNPAQSRRGGRERVRLPAEHQEVDYLRLEEIPAYLAGCSRTYRPLAELLIATGLRISEALALRWEDVDLDAGRIRVMRALKKDGIGSTKGDRARAVDIGPRLDAVLRDLRAYQSCFFPVGPSTEVFTRRDGTVPSRHGVSSSAHKDALRRARLRTSIRLHDLRHSAAASWLAAGLPLIYVQRQLGHASLTTTEQIYAHLEGGMFDGASERAERAIWDGVGPRAA